jgi:predicted Zn-dependent protease
VTALTGKRLVASILAAALTASCAPTHVAPISTAGAAFKPDPDERKLWDEARAEEKKLREKVALYNDPLLVDYLQGVADRLTPPGMTANPEIRYSVSVIEDPTLNAFAYPHGSVYVHTGLLARMENEDELATVLGHEMTHVEDRHTLRSQRDAQNKQMGFAVAAIAAGVLTAGASGHAYEQGNWTQGAMIGVMSQVLVGLGLNLAMMASVNGYGRELEREADMGGFDKMTRAGYDTRQAPKVFEALLEEHGDSSKAEAFFFGNHPRLHERIDSANEWLSAHPSTAPPNVTGDPEGFQARIRPVIRDDARLNIDAGRLPLAEAELARVEPLLPNDPIVHELKGRLALKKADAAPEAAAKAALKKAALASYRESIRLDPNRPVPHREVGLLAYRAGDFATACVEFGQYLELAGAAPDAQSIRDYRLELRKQGRCP